MSLLAGPQAIANHEQGSFVIVTDKLGCGYEEMSPGIYVTAVRLPT